MESQAKNMIDSILCYIPDGINNTAEEVLDSFYGKHYLTEYTKRFGKKKMIEWIEQRKARIERITPLNDNGYRSIIHKEAK